MAASRAASVVLTRRAASSEGASPPTNTVTAESECIPLPDRAEVERQEVALAQHAPGDGMPWTISSLTDAQIVAGYVPL